MSDLSTGPRATDRRFARRRVIVIRHRGNLANKTLQYMGALTLANRIKDCTIVNVSIPEWGIEIPDDTQNELFFDNVDLWTWDPFRPHVEELCAMANESQSIRIMMGDHLLRMEFLMQPQFYNHIFPKGPLLSHEVTEKDLVINIRTAEILDGVSHYPLIPIAFYEDVVARMGLNPVFVGQLNQSEYVQQLRQRFPEGRFIGSQGARADFDLIRSAKNIVVAVSTFSWLAAWLSEAKTIIVPLSGFYNPAHHREVDLLPVDDIRYRFFLFPLNYGLPEKESLEYHERMKGRWKEISRSQVALLKTASPFLRVPRENYDNGLPTRFARGAAITFDPIWYAHQYVDAAMEISDGWFEDPLHHYLEVGRLRGYMPTRPIQDEVTLDLTLPNLALNKRATQSSLSSWSKGSTLEEDARNAVNGDPSKDYGFCTNNDSNPWWMVDLGRRARIQFMRIFNRDNTPEQIQRRASPLIVEASCDGQQWKTLFRTEHRYLFGGYSGGRPLVWSTKERIEARYVRISVPRLEYLHLAEVEIYGSEIPQAETDSATEHKNKAAVICDIEWLSTFIANEHYYLVKLLQDQHGFDVINTHGFDFLTHQSDVIKPTAVDFSNVDMLRKLNSYDVLLIAYQGFVDLPLHLISAYKIFKIDDLVSYNREYDRIVNSLIKNSNIVIGPYAYEFHRYYKHNNVVWVPYSSALEGCKDSEQIDFNTVPMEKVLLTGSIAWDRPFRQYVASLKNEMIEVLQHPGYDKRYDENSQEIVGIKYYRKLSKYLCCFSDAHSYRYIHLKNFEIASVGSLLLTDKIIEAEMNELGFVDFETCIFCDQQTFLEKLSWIFDPKNRAVVDKIRRAGMELVREKHLTRHRALQINTLVSRAKSRLTHSIAREPQPAS